MSKAGTISKLEGLLERIRTRAAQPRPARGAVLAAAPAVAAAAPVVASKPAPAPVAAAPAPAARPFSPAAGVSRGPSPAPPPVEAKVPPPAPSSDIEFAVDVDVPAPTPAPAPVAAEAPREAFDSRERIAAAAPVEPAPAASLEDALTSVVSVPASLAPAVEVEVAEAELSESIPPEATASAAPADAGPTIEQVEVLSEEEAIGGEEDEEIVEAPASSRRPVAAAPEQRLADLAFGTEEPQPARHTPPPKSGRLPAPPAVDFDGDVTGVRSAVSSEGAATQASAQSAPSVLTPQPLRPDLAASAGARVADVIGDAQKFAPATFVELLDATLSL